MSYGLFHLLGRVARLVAEAAARVYWSRSGRAGTTGKRRRHDDKDHLLPRMTDLANDRLSGAALAAVAGTGWALLNRPSVRASLESFVLRTFQSPGEHFQQIEDARAGAAAVAKILQERGVVPDKIGVDGLPGSGKSTLSRALADALSFDWKPLDHQNMNVPRDFTQQRTIYEHHRLFRTQDVDAFDVVIHVDELVEVSKARILQRASLEAR